MTTVIYARVSTEDQDLEHQKENLWTYATDDLNIPTEDIDALEDKSTGTDTDRSGYREMLERVRGGEVDKIIVREVTRLGRAMREISENVHEIIEDHGCGLYVQNDQLEIAPDGELSMQDKMMLSVLAWAAELEAKKTRENIISGLRAAEKAGKWTKRPPYGFTTDDDGYLLPTDDFQDAVAAIRMIEDYGWSKSKTSRHTGIARSTIRNILDRQEMYLDDFS